MRANSLSADMQRSPMDQISHYVFRYVKTVVRDFLRDRALGIAICQAASDKEVGKIAADDPAIRQGAIHVEVHPYKLSLFRAPTALK